MNFKKLVNGKPKRKQELEWKSVGLLIDGPNCFREEFDVDLDELRDIALQYGRLVVARCYLNAYAPAGLIEAIESRGFETIITSGDVDVRLAVDATEIAVNGTTEILAIASRDIDFKPAIELASRYGLRTVVIAPSEHGKSEGLTKAAHETVVLNSGSNKKVLTNGSNKKE